MQALQEHPAAFAISYDEAKAKPSDFWQGFLTRSTSHMLGLFDNDNLIGITSIYVDSAYSDGSVGGMGMSYILPDYRLKGLS